MTQNYPIFLLSPQTAMDQLHMHFTQAIHNTVFQVVLGYVELCAGNADTKFQKMQYKDLCTVSPFPIRPLPIPPVGGYPGKLVNKHTSKIIVSHIRCSSMKSFVVFVLIVL